jgi:hypothetical protein
MTDLNLHGQIESKNSLFKNIPTTFLGRQIFWQKFRSAWEIWPGWGAKS